MRMRLRTRLHPAVGRVARPLRFGIVGASGVLVNSLALWVLVQGSRLSIPLASAIATELAIITNFLLNDRWTFGRTAARRSRWRRFVRYNSVAAGGLAITALLLTVLTRYANMPLLLANLLAIGVAMGWNYMLSSRWAWLSAPRET